MTEFWVPSADLRVWEGHTGVGRATGIAAEQVDNTGLRRPARLVPTDPSLTYHVNLPTNDGQPYVREDDANLVEGRMLKATANYNLAADPASWPFWRSEKVT